MLDVSTYTEHPCFLNKSIEKFKKLTNKYVSLLFFGKIEKKMNKPLKYKRENDSKKNLTYEM